MCIRGLLLERYTLTDACVESAVDSLSLWLGATPESIKGYVDREALNCLGRGLLGEEVSDFQRYGKMAVQPLLGFLPSGVRWKLTDGVKRMKGMAGSKKKGINDCELVSIFLRLRESLGADGIKWNGGKKAMICITHDVDYLSCYKAVPSVVDMEKEYGVRSSFNFLTHWDYKVDRHLILDLAYEAFEIGLHGCTHDIALAYRSKSHVREAINRALGELPTEISGFRAPTLSWSKLLVSVLDEVGFVYDSSLPVGSWYRRGVGTCFPYRYPGYRIWEVPLLIQDDTLFRDLRMGEEEALEAVRTLIEEVATIGGVAVINMHPSIIKKRRRFYTQLLKFISSDRCLSVSPIKEMISYLESMERQARR